MAANQGLVGQPPKLPGTIETLQNFEQEVGNRKVFADTLGCSMLCSSKDRIVKKVEAIIQANNSFQKIDKHTQQRYVVGLQNGDKL